MNRAVPVTILVICAVQVVMGVVILNRAAPFVTPNAIKSIVYSVIIPATVIVQVVRFVIPVVIHRHAQLVTPVTRRRCAPTVIINATETVAPVITQPMDTPHV